MVADKALMLTASPNVRLIIEYDGSGFHGFQRQSFGRTVQGELEQAIGALLRRPVGITGAGRTDAGVHAAGQVVNFTCPDHMPLKRMLAALNRMLPADIVVLKADVVDAEFHARYSAKSRLYEYTILNRVRPSARESRFVWHVAKVLDMSAMTEAGALILGSHDFRGFGSPERGRSPVRNLERLQITRRGSHVRVTCQANAFLQHMARGIVGALVDVATGRRSVQDVRVALEEPERPVSFSIAPPTGLSLVLVEY